MNFYEEEAAKCHKRIKKIEENPDPTKAKSNKLLYEIERDMYLARLQAAKEGKPFMEGFPPALIRGYGFEPMGLDICASKSTLGQNRFNTIRAIGLPDYACDLIIVGTDMCMKKELPMPQFLVTQNCACDPFKLAHNFLGRHFNIPIACLDFGFQANLDSVCYVADQLRDIADYSAKKVPGTKYDESKLAEAQYWDRQANKYLNDIYQLRKLSPCPLAGKDTFRIPLMPSYAHDPKKVVDYFRIWRDEMQEKADKGIGAVAEEKLRVLWAVSGPFFVDPFAVLEKRGVSIPWFQYDIAMRWSGVKYPLYGSDIEYGRKLTPLEEEASRMLNFSWGGLAERWVEDTMYVCRDIKVDAIINFRQMGCTATTGIAKLLEQRAEKELGIPTLNFEGRQLDMSYFDAGQVNSQLNLFVDSLLRKKGLPLS